MKYTIDNGNKAWNIANRTEATKWDGKELVGNVWEYCFSSNVCGKVIEQI